MYKLKDLFTFRIGLKVVFVLVFVIFVIKFKKIFFKKEGIVRVLECRMFVFFGFWWGDFENFWK